MSTKRDMIKIETPEGIKLSVPAHVVVTTFISAALAQIGTPQPTAAPAQTLSTQSTPAVGEYWPGQGGINGGWVAAHDGVPAHYLIWATKDAGKHKWGGYEKESKATSKRDGLANTKALLAEGDHPAVLAAAIRADGHYDFYLPAAAELYHGWLNVPQIFAQDRWYWSSSQRSANHAFYMSFDGGCQSLSGKSYELSVRPVRRAFI
ncbi:DUF1566 domain-containing protein [Pseudomonas leptonychotis]|uniref:DUF1566 domain-containing protein n=1 Tax=Pseudomonas leptonychotis TaxID=2448482 RepID=UPI00386321C4